MIGRLLFLLAIGSCLCDSLALADKERARRAFREGTQHYNLTEYPLALESFKAAYRELEDPAFLFNIAQCFRQLNDKTQAVRFYQSYLRELPDAPNHDEVANVISRKVARSDGEGDADSAVACVRASA